MEFIIKEKEMRVSTRDEEIFWDEDIIPWHRYNLLISTEVFRNAVKQKTEIECKKRLMELFGLFVDASLEK